MLYVKDTPTRTRISLDGIWDFKLLDGEEYDVLNCMNGGRPMAVPSSYNDIYEGVEVRDHIGWVAYERTFDFAQSLGDKSLILRFGSVTQHARVYLNGEFLGSHKGGFLPFEFDITDKVRTSGNRLTVLVSNIIDHSTLPCGTLEKHSVPGCEPITVDVPNFDFFNYSGIMRPVCLYLIPRSHITAVRINARMDGSLSYEVDHEGKGSVCVSVMDGDRALWSCEGSCGEGKVADVEPWDVDNPRLYALKVVLSGDDGMDEYSEVFGFRTIEVRDCAFYLNGRKTYLKGFGKHEDIPVLGRGINEAYNVKDLALMKWMGSNSFRTSHYPYSEEMMNLCDRMGILVIDETPAVGMHVTHTSSGIAINCTSGTWDTLKTADHHMDVLRDMIERDGNHPCVVIWSVANEPGSEEPGAGAYFKPLFDYVHEKDWQGRPVTFVTHSEATVETCEVAPFCDVLAINRYYGWYDESGNIPAAAAILTDELDRYHRRYPDKPIMLGEFGADTIPGFHDSTAAMFSEEFQVEFLKAYCDVLDSKDYIFGEHVWNFADFATSQSIRRVQGNKKGVFTRERKPKMAAWYLKERWSK